ncbi:MAG: ZIP family metal transporter [Lachnospiraceae bacterium]|nr:ZIP family metal transporter [Lachnospiraceae bacterium]
MQLFTGIITPLLGTTVGAAMVFLIKKEILRQLEKLLLGFAAGVMIAASVWSLLIPAIDLSTEQGKIPWVPATVGFLLGMSFLLLLDSVIRHLHIDKVSDDQAKRVKTSRSKIAMLVFAVTLHNIPEGMAVGVSFAGAMMGNTGISFAGAFVLAVGIAIQNIPEGAIISMPLHGAGATKKKAFGYAFLSGVTEPVAALVTILLTRTILPVLPYLLAFAAGAMIYVVVEELIPESQSGNQTNIATIGVAAGFVLMMVLDVALG